jgi:hypothetical protein
MKFTSDPAYRTSTGPDPVAGLAEVADGVAAALLLAAEVAGAAAELELDELEPQAARAMLAHASPATASVRKLQR